MVVASAKKHMVMQKVEIVAFSVRYRHAKYHMMNRRCTNKKNIKRKVVKKAKDMTTINSRPTSIKQHTLVFPRSSTSSTSL